MQAWEYRPSLDRGINIKDDTLWSNIEIRHPTLPFPLISLHHITTPTHLQPPRPPDSDIAVVGRFCFCSSLTTFHDIEFTPYHSSESIIYFLRAPRNLTTLRTNSELLDLEISLPWTSRLPFAASRLQNSSSILSSSFSPEHLPTSTFSELPLQWPHSFPCSHSTDLHP